MSFLIKTYRILTYGFQLYAPILLRNRLKKGKELADRYQEKMGVYTHKNIESKKLIWVHVASVGELNSAIPIIKKMAKKNREFLVTSCTKSSAEAFAKANLKFTTHQFAPLDCPKFIKSFLKYWNPDMGILVDSEIWPNLITEASKEMPLLLLNARLSDKSWKRWCYFPATARKLFSCFSRVMPTSADDKKKISTFVSDDKIIDIGNLKYAEPIISDEKLDAAKWLKNEIKNRPSWIAATIHEEEIESIINAHLLLQQNTQNVLSIIAPKHLKTVESIENLAQQHNLKIAKRSLKDALSSDVNVYILDTVGELNAMFSATDIAFVGGSLFDHGGHNIIEPARFANAILSGPHTHNFRDIVTEFQKEKALLIVQDSQELAKQIEKLFVDSKLRQCLGTNAKQLTIKHANVISNAIEQIEKFL